jgi:hypothetical protein
MDTETKVVEEKRIWEEGKEKYATNGKGNSALTLGIIGTALGAYALWGRNGGGLFGGGNSLPENININTLAGASSGVAPTAFETYAKGCEETLALTNEMWGMKLNTQNEFYANRNTDIAEKFSLWKGQIDADFSLYKGYRDMGDAINAQMYAANFALYQSQRNGFDALSAKIASLEKDVAVNAAIRPYQDKLIQCEIDKAYTASVNYTDRKTCRCLQGELILPNTVTSGGYGSYTPCSASNTTA